MVYLKEKKGITLISLIITIVIMLILAGVAVKVVIGGLLGKSEDAVYFHKIGQREDEVQSEEAEFTIDNKLDSYKNNMTIDGDYIQPWMCTTWEQSDFDTYFKKLKNAGMTYSILQYTANMKSDNGTMKFKEIYAWLDDTNPKAADIRANSISSVYVSDQNVLDNYVKAAHDNGIKVFLGLSVADGWFGEDVKNETWRNQVNGLNELLAQYLIDEYSDSYPNTFYGIFYPLEFYTNTENFEELYWYDMLKDVRTSVKSYEKGYLSELPFMISTYCSDMDSYEIKGTEEEIKNKMKESFKKMIEKDGTYSLLNNDIIAPQDKLATLTNRNIKYTITYLKALREAIDELNKENINFKYWINVENFNYIPRPSTKKIENASLDRIKAQISICEEYADNLIGFSYGHYFLNEVDNKPVAENNKIENQYDDYVKKVKKDYGDSLKNKNVTKKEFDNGTYVFIPKGFYYVCGDITSGVVISDNSEDENLGEAYWNAKGNQFVWVPIDGGYHNLLRDNFRIADIKLSNSKEDDCYWEDEDSAYDAMIASIKKYNGFYVARYETTGTKDDISYKAGLNVLNNMSDVEEAKKLSSDLYKDSSSVVSHLMYGIEWDSTLNSFIDRGKLYSNNNVFNMIQLKNSSAWGNYAEETYPVDPSVHGSQKASGSTDRLDTQVCHIFDMAGNFWEITQEKYGLEGKATLRGGSFWEAGNTNPASNRFVPLPNSGYDFLISFRTALYLK